MMHYKSIFEEFKSLSSSNENKTFSVIPVLNTEHKLGISKEGYPKVFVCTNDTTSTTPNRLLNILTVEYNLSCTFIDENNSEITHYTVITLRSTDASLQEYFLNIVIMMLDRLPIKPSKKDISIEVEYLISIFSAMTCPPRKKIQGLWAELLVIERSKNPETLINAWHQTPTAKYDFTMGRDKLEVKSTSSGTRTHQFSLEQLWPSANSRVIIASTIVRESASGEGGLSVSDLCDKLFQRVSSIDARIYVMKVIAETIGKDVQKMNEIHFDYYEASDTLKFYDTKDVPKIDNASVKAGVSNIRFTSDLTGIIDIQAKYPPYERENSPLYMSLYE